MFFRGQAYALRPTTLTKFDDWRIILKFMTTPTIADSDPLKAHQLPDGTVGDQSEILTLLNLVYFELTEIKRKQSADSMRLGGLQEAMDHLYRDIYDKFSGR